MSRFIPDSAQFRRLIQFIDGLRHTDFMIPEVPRHDLPDRDAVRRNIEWLLQEGFIRLKKDGAKHDTHIYAASETWELLVKELK